MSIFVYDFQLPKDAENVFLQKNRDSHLCSDMTANDKHGQAPMEKFRHIIVADQSVEWK